MLPVLPSSKSRLIFCATGINHDQGDSCSTAGMSSLIVRVGERYDTEVNLHCEMVTYCTSVLLFFQMIQGPYHKQMEAFL